MSTNIASVRQFSQEIVKRALEYLGAYSKEAHILVLGTALTESELQYLRQIGGGPALGYFQMEPDTEQDIWENFLRHRKSLFKKVTDIIIPAMDIEQQLAFNPIYAACMCRIHYLRVKEPIPDADDTLALSRYWKDHYNTRNGSGSVDKAYKHFLMAHGVVTGNYRAAE